VIRKANHRDQAALREIWGAAFGDGPDYAAFVTAQCLEKGTVLYCPEGRSMLTLFPLSLAFYGKMMLQGYYVYGVATHPVQQHKGFSSMLLEMAARDAAFLLLFPATAELSRFYRKRGFSTSVSVPAPILAEQSAISPENRLQQAPYMTYRERAGQHQYAFIWSEPLFDFAYRECMFRSGLVLPPWFCYPAEKRFVCKPYMIPEKPGTTSFVQALGRFLVPVPGLHEKNSIFFLPLD